MKFNLNYGEIVGRKALTIIDIHENLVTPYSKFHIDTTGIDFLFANLNESIVKFNDNKDLVLYVVNEWTNPLLNLVNRNTCKKGAAGSVLLTEIFSYYNEVKIE